MAFVRRVLFSVLLGLTMTTLAHVPAQAATADPIVATPSVPMSGEQLSLSGQVPVTGGVARTVVLQRIESGQWKPIKSKATSTTGAYRFVVRISKPTYFRVHAPATGTDAAAYTPPKLVSVAKQGVAAWISRGCGSDNRCGGNAFAEGYVRPIRENRLVVLQIVSGGSWKTVAKGRTDADGDFNIKFSIGGWSQWSARRFRVVAASYALSTKAVSAPISFMPGPTRIGRNVLRVEVDGGASPSTKGVDYKGFATLIQDDVVKIKRARLDKFGVRGSTTSRYPKKPYNLRFDQPPPASGFGMDADRRWTLLAMYADQSFVREKTALDLGRKLTALDHGSAGRGMTWNPESRYVEMFVNSEYKGAYLLAEKVNIDGDKVDVDKETGMIMETDMDEVEDPRKGFRASRSGLIFAFKDPDGYGGAQGITSTKLSRIKSKVASVESYLYTTNRTSYRAVIDRESAVDFYLAQEFIKDTDADFWRSKYFSWDMDDGSCPELCNGKLHFGPLWDFDKSIGNIDPTNPATAFIRSYRGWHANGTGIGKAHHVTYHTHWFAQLWKVSAYRGYVKYRWKQAKPIFYKTWSQEVAKNKALIGVGAYNDRKRWAGASKLYAPKGSGYDGEVSYVANWLKNRYSWMNGQLS